MFPRRKVQTTQFGDIVSVVAFRTFFAAVEKKTIEAEMMIFFKRFARFMRRKGENAKVRFKKKILKDLTKIFLKFPFLRRRAKRDALLFASDFLPKCDIPHY